MSATNRMFIDIRLTESKAWISLTGKAPQVLSIFWKKRKFAKSGRKRKGRQEYLMTNNGEITFLYSEALEKYEIKKDTFRRALRQLHNRGFLDVTNPGGGIHKAPAKFALSDRWTDYGTHKFKLIPWPERDPSCPGFKKGNKNLTMRKNTHGTMSKNTHGEGETDQTSMRENAHGEKRKNSAKPNNTKEIEQKAAQKAHHAQKPDVSIDCHLPEEQKAKPGRSLAECKEILKAEGDL